MISSAASDAIPKAELHCHLEGALHLDILWEFSQRHEPGRHASFEAFKAAVTVAPDEFPGFKKFLSKFEPLRFHYGTLGDIERLVFESVRAMGPACYREFRFSPVFFGRRLFKEQLGNTASFSLPLSIAEEASECVIRAVNAAVAQTGNYPHEFILTCNRGFGYAVNKSSLDLLHRPIGEKIRGLDLAGDESADAADFFKPFREWKEAGKILTIHAGEDPNAGGPLSILEALDVFKTDRIGHGVRAIEDPKLVARLAAERVPLEMCPTSNFQTHAVLRNSAHPIKPLFDAGCCVTISTDDPVMCGVTINDEYVLAVWLGMTYDDLRHCTRNAISAGMLSAERKGELMTTVNRR